MRQQQGAATQKQLPAVQPAGQRREQALPGKGQRLGMLDPGRLFPSLADWFGGRTYPMQIAPLDAGLLVVFAFGGISIIGAMLAGWSSANKFSMLGAIRSASQMISYELVMGLTVLGLILIYGTVDLDANRVAHGHPGSLQQLASQPHALTVAPLRDPGLHGHLRISIVYP